MLPLLVTALFALPAAPPVALLRGEAGVSLGPSARFAVDARRVLTAAQVLDPALAEGLEPFGRELRGFGVQTAPIWLRAEVEAGSGGQYFLVFNAPQVEHLDAWVLHPWGRVDHFAGGTALPPEARQFVHRGGYHAAPVALSPGERVTIAVRAQTRGVVYVAVDLRTERELERADVDGAVVLAFGAGVILVFVSMSLYAFFALRDRWSLRYAALLVCFGGFQLSMTGIIQSALLGNFPGLAISVRPALVSACAALLFDYGRCFTGSAEHNPRVDRWARLAQWGAWVLAALAFALPAQISLVAPPMISLAMAVAVTLGVAAVARGDRPARFFLASMTIVFISGIALAGASLGLIPASGFTVHGVHAGVWLSALVLNLGFADRLEMAHRSSRAELEQTVAARTADVERTLSELRESEERLRVAFDTGPDAILITRLEDGVAVAANRGFTELTGFAIAEVVGSSAHALDLWPREAERSQVLAEVRAGRGVRDLEVKLRRKDSVLVTVLLSAQRLDLRGAPYALAVVRDVTAQREADAERARLQDQLRQSQKMEAIGQLAGGVAHDFNNLLTAVTVNAELALDELEAASPARESLLEIGEAARRAAQLTRQLLAFGRRQLIEPRPLDLAVQTGAMASMLRRLIGEQIELRLETLPGKCLVLADLGQTEQVLVNLVVNARDALRGRAGTIVIATGAAERLQPGGGLARYGMLSVKDDGEGMTPEVLARIFEPFFTTKQGNGTGLGLSTAYGIVAQHRGLIEVDSTPGVGTTFRVLLPETNDAVAPVVVELPRALTRGSGTVLLAEDEPAVRAATRAVIERLGYRVLAAADGAEALQICQVHPGSIDALVTDVIMPRMNGRELAEKLRKLRPEAAVIYLSGYSEEVIAHSGVLDPGITFIQKPYQTQTLAAALSRATARAA